MASFDFVIAMKLPALEDTNVNAVKTFLAAPKYYYSTLTPAAQLELLKFLVDVKVTKKAKTRLGSDQYISYDTFEAACLQKVPPTETSEELRYKIATCRQGHKRVTDFASELENLAERLTEATFRSCNTADKETIKTMSNAWALDSFKANVREDLRPVVVAARPTSLQDALLVVKESNLDKYPATSGVNYFHQTRGRGRGNRGNFRGRRNNPQRPAQHQNQQYQQQHQQQQNQQQTGQQQQRGQSFGRGPRRGRGRGTLYQPTVSNNRNVYEQQEQENQQTLNERR